MKHINLLVKFVLLRKILRKLGLNPILHKFIYSNNTYEEHFDKLFSSKIEPGFVVYDIGANIGHYSQIYSDLVGDKGRIVAFEPSQKNFQKLQDIMKNHNNVIGVNCAVGAASGEFWLSQGSDEIGATSQILESESGEGNWVSIEPLDTLVIQYGLPNALKIDVEGFELEVLEGGHRVLRDNNIRVIGIEIHTDILNSKGIKNPHEEIKRILKNNGFKITHTDFSHIIGYK